MIFALQIEEIIDDEQVVDFLIAQFGLTKMDINKLLEDNVNALVNYEILYRDYPSEFKGELLFFLKDETCLRLEIYNSLNVALRYIDFFSKKVVIKDQSRDPFRWILITNSKKVFIVDEIIYEGEGLFINYNTLKEITIDRAMEVLPSRSYYFIKPEDRPVHFNQDPTWG